MVTSEKFSKNLKELKKIIPSKPAIYTSEHPKSIKEALLYYCNKTTVHLVQACTSILNESNWPLPLWFDPENVRMGFWNKLYYRKYSTSFKKKGAFKRLKEFDFCSVLVINHVLYGMSFDEILIEAFDSNNKYAFRVLMSSPVLKEKQEILESAKKSYTKRNWIACVSILFPLIDFIARKLLNTRKLSVDVSRIGKLFAQNGFSLENANDLMPHFEYVSSRMPGQAFIKADIEERYLKMKETDFGLVGPALSSFIRFSNIYYSYYKEDTETKPVILLNRHAILHGSITNFGTKANTVKLITFLYLMLELEDPFKILLEG